jgi:hypothetical protein
MAFLIVFKQDCVIQLPSDHRKEHLCAIGDGVEVRVATDTAAFFYSKPFYLTYPESHYSCCLYAATIHVATSLQHSKDSTPLE